MCGFSASPGDGSASLFAVVLVASAFASALVSVELPAPPLSPLVLSPPVGFAPAWSEPLLAGVLLAGVLLVELSFGTPNCGRSELLLDPLVWLPVVAAGALAAAGVPGANRCEAGAAKRSVP
jgi:hypothetical protein